MGPSGTLDCDNVAIALLNYRNTPDRDLGRSPAQVMFGRSLNDSIPMSKERLKPSIEWMITKEQRENALKAR